MHFRGEPGFDIDYTGELFGIQKIVLCYKENMPIDKQNKDRSRYPPDKALTLTHRRQDIYKELSTDKREALLSQRRTRYLQSKNQSRCNNSSTSFDNRQTTSFKVPGALPREKTLTIQEPSCIHENGVDGFVDVLGKGKSIAAVEITKRRPTTPIIATTLRNDDFTLAKAMGNNLASFEVGSTSTLPNKCSNPDATITASTSNVTGQHIPEALTCRSKGSRFKCRDR